MTTMDKKKAKRIAQTELDAALRRMNRESWRAYVRELRVLDKRSREAQARQPRIIEVSLRTFDADHPGHPLGKGYPPGETFRMDGESHRAAWMRVLRADPCAYCGERIGTTVDHIEPKRYPTNAIGGTHSWLNYTGACHSCNGGKKAHSLLDYLYRRKWNRPVEARTLGDMRRARKMARRMVGSR